MKTIKRVAIIGNAGSGKSSLAQKLQLILNLPVYHLDKYFWKPGWIPPVPAEYKKIHDALCEQERWIIDGMNLRLLEHRLQHADIIIFLDIPRHICFWRIFKRTFKYYGKVSPTSARGCAEGISFKFVRFLKWVWDFKINYRPHILELFNIYSKTKKLYIFKTPQEITLFLEALKN